MLTAIAARPYLVVLEYSYETSKGGMRDNGTLKWLSTAYSIDH